MSFTRWFVYASFGGVLAFSLQPSGMAHATPSLIVLVADQSSSSSQDMQRDSRSGKAGAANAEVSGKMQSERNAPSGGGNMNPSSRSDGSSSRGQGSEVAPGSTDPRAPTSSGASPSPGISTLGGGPETSGEGTNAGPR